MKGKTNSHKPDTYIPSELVSINVTGPEGIPPEGFEVTISKFIDIETDYIELDYIESTGTQYIDTGFIPNQDTRVIIDCIVNIPNVSMDEHAGVICVIDSGGKTFGLGYDNGINASEGKCIFSYNTSKKELKDNYESLGTRHVFDINKNKLLRNGVELCSATSTSFQCNAPLYLSAINRNGVVYSYNTTSLALYSCKIYDNDILVRDFVPALHPDGTAGLYDKVNNKFYMSASDTHFNAGNQKNFIKIPGEQEIIDVQTDINNTYKIPLGTTYVITPSKEQGYTAQKQTITASQIKRNVDIVYEAVEYGVFIMDASGNIGNVNDWTSSKGVTGVTLVTEDVEIVIAPDRWADDYNGSWNGNSMSAWGGYGKNVTGVKTTTSNTDAALDFAGLNNTNQIIKQLSGTTDSYSSYYTGAPAAEYCRAYSKGYKAAGQWYLPSAGEMDQLIINQDAINEALNKISGKTLNFCEATWTSTQADSYRAWFGDWFNYLLSYHYKHGSGYDYEVRPICQIENTTGNIITFKIGGVSYLGENQMTWQDWINSSYNTAGFKNTNNYLCTSSGVQVKFNNSLVSITSLITPSGNYISPSCAVVLNSQWQASSKSNPDSLLYNIYESYSNYNVNSGTAIMYIDIVGYTEFTCYIRSYAESSYDYVMISQLDKTITGSSSYSDTSLVKANTRGNQQSGTALSNYTKVTYSGIDGGSHRITVVYKKDSSVNKGDDKGYILVPKQ